jgi:hypothetical protein
MKNDVFLGVTPCGFVITDVSEELSASFIRVKRTGELGTTLAVTRNTKLGISSQRAAVANYS